MEKHLNPKNHDESRRSTQKKQIFECVICDLIFPKLWIYKNHEKQYHSGQIDIKSEPNENLYESTQENHEDKPFACKFCPERFENVEKIMQHIKIHETDEKNVLEKDDNTIEVLSDESSDLEVIGKLHITSDAIKIGPNSLMFYYCGWFDF